MQTRLARSGLGKVIESLEWDAATAKHEESSAMNIAKVDVRNVAVTVSSATTVVLSQPPRDDFSSCRQRIAIRIKKPCRDLQVSNHRRRIHRAS
jgi:hypothetical protein